LAKLIDITTQFQLLLKFVFARWFSAADGARKVKKKSISAERESLRTGTMPLVERKGNPPCFVKVLNRLGSLKPRLLAGIGLAILVVSIYTLRSPVVYAGPETAPEKPPEKKSLSGADLYAIHCNRCHSERYATEFTSAHWKTIMMHMRVRANLTTEQAREVLKYLQEDSGQ
jgi:hypothetical protein